MFRKNRAKEFFARITAFVLAAALVWTPNMIPAKAAQTLGSGGVEYTKTSLRNVMYYGDWSVWSGQGNFYPGGIPADQLTHLNFAFLDFDASGNLIFCDKDAATGVPAGMSGVTYGDVNGGVLSALQDLRAENPNLRIGVSIGGWSRSGDFTKMTANAAARANFVSNVMKFVKYTNMDFVDIDWEYPGQMRLGDTVDLSGDEGTPYGNAADKQNYILLLQDLRTALDAQGVQLGRTYELSVALPASKNMLQLGIDIPALFGVVDFANIMTYDLYGSWNDFSAFHSGLYTNPANPDGADGISVDNSVKYLLSQGAPSQKIVIGAALYTRGWENVANDGGVEGCPGLFGTATKVNRDAAGEYTYGAWNEAACKIGEGGRLGGVWGYGSLDKLKAKYPGLVEYWDDVAKAPYLYNAATGAFFGYDNVRSVTEKANYVKQYNLGGMISWMASQDAETTVAGQRDELTKAMKTGLFGTGELPQYVIGDTAIDVTATVTTYEENGYSGYEITIKNNAVKNESGDVLARVEEMAETVKLPKVYIKTESGAALSKGDYRCGSVTNSSGYAVINLAEVYAAKLINQGTSYTFRVQTSGTADTADIACIELAQRIKSNGVEISRQVILGSPIIADKYPVILGASNKTIYTNTMFLPMDGVTANDVEDGNLTSSITVSGSVNTAVEGDYTLVYSVTDSAGNTTSVTRVISVIMKVDAKPTISGATAKTITVGTAFDPLAGVTASDAEDGNLTASITVSGSVNTAVVNTYNLVYSVTDSAGQTVSVTRVITVAAKVDEKPVISGAAAKTITVGDSFNAMTGVTASDAEDGNLTSSIIITGSVDTATAGTYTLVYSVTDSAGQKVDVTRVITVKAPVGDGSYDIDTIYVLGDTVTYNGSTYRAKWWTKGDIPGEADVWELISTGSGDENVISPYNPNKAYFAGEMVTYEGVTYCAKWWTKGETPGSGTSWEVVS